MSTTSGRYCSTAGTAAAPSPTDATISTSARSPSSSSSASRKTLLSSTSRIRIGRSMIGRTLLGRQKQVVVGLTPVLDVDLEVGMRLLDVRDQLLQLRLVLP